MGGAGGCVCVRRQVADPGLFAAARAVLVPAVSAAVATGTHGTPPHAFPPPTISTRLSQPIALRPALPRLSAPMSADASGWAAAEWAAYLTDSRFAQLEGAQCDRSLDPCAQARRGPERNKPITWLMNCA